MIPIDGKKFARLARQCGNYDVPAMRLSEYYGEASPHPLSRALVEAVQECLEYLPMMEDEEVEGVLRDMPEFFRMCVGERPLDAEDPEYLKRVAIFHLATLIDRRSRSVRDVVRGDPKPDPSSSEVLRVYPELENKLDSDGLLRIDDGLRLADRGIFYRDHVLQYHWFFRGGDHGSSPNTDFLWRFRQYHGDTKDRNLFAIAIDHSRLMPKEAYADLIELSAWYGPRFSQEVLDDPRAVGLAVVGREQSPYFSLLGPSSLERTEFYWQHADGVKTFEAEEISTREQLYDPYYLNRYVHAERDIENRRFRHFDGAIKAYSKDRYERRLAARIPREDRSQHKNKLFRIDGAVDADRWLDLTAFFFRGNEMVLRYFDPEKYERLYREKIESYRTFKNPSGSGR